MTTGPDDAKLHQCPALIAIKALSGKWKTRILWLLRERPFHFGELRQVLPGVSSKVLAEQLDQLEQDGLVMRQEALQKGVVFAYYSYSDYGRRLVPILDSLGHWGLEHLSRGSGQALQP